MWAMPFAPPPLSTTATFFLPPVDLDAMLSLCAHIVLHISAATRVVSRVFFISYAFLDYSLGTNVMKKTQIANIGRFL
jgi:hypothetical protein